jgi:hypothetical protein
MTNDEAKKLADAIMRDVFGREQPFSLEQLETLLTKGIQLPIKTTCVMTGQEAYIHDPQPGTKVISEAAFMNRAKTDDWMQPVRDLSNITDVLRAADEGKYMTAGKAPNSQNVAKSDSVIASSGVYFSSLIGNSKNVLLSHDCFFSNYSLACRGNSSCNFCVRTFDSTYCSSSFEVRWSNKVSKSMFINDCLDLYECLFCYGIRSKKYCVANVQLSQEEYQRVKGIVVDWIFSTYIPGM